MDVGAVATWGSAVEPIAFVERDGHIEAVHSAVAIGLAVNGEIEFEIGDPRLPVLSRSAWKPIQAVAMTESGLGLEGRHLAVACASHSGSPEHVRIVREILECGGLGVDALCNVPGHPFDVTCMEASLRDGVGATRIAMNCSGKHAAMLLTSVRNGWPTDSSYLSVGHPVQQAIAATGKALGGASVTPASIDGCGVPAFSCTLEALARAFRAIALGDEGSAEAAVYSAMVSHPRLAAGSGRVATDFMLACPGLLAKDGAEGVIAAATRDGRAVALKVADGSTRPWRPFLTACLRRLGCDVEEGTHSRSFVYGGGEVVGETQLMGDAEAWRVSRSLNGHA